MRPSILAPPVSATALVMIVMSAAAQGAGAGSHDGGPLDLPVQVADRGAAGTGDVPGQSGVGVSMVRPGWKPAVPAAEKADFDRGDPGAVGRAAKGRLTVLGTPDDLPPRSAPPIVTMWSALATAPGIEQRGWCWVDDPIGDQPSAPALVRELDSGEEAVLIGRRWR
ncbi:hypothetical protein [Arenibaculum pallidiluteum]|uniref:hypothetical protein n=1 Tax=Arenibaculum pallidiluteum TaxID=2812559 RepID=UPI001A967B2A|nr:hypothetical protein [Arenibaculum pallidiluteum]